MGRTYLFECAKCGYRAQVAGGASAGGHFAVQTIVCADCRALYDAVIRYKASTRQRDNPPNAGPPFAAMLNRLPPHGVRSWLKLKPACPVSALHRIRPWKQPDKCPKCGNFMEPQSLPFRLWD